MQLLKLPRCERGHANLQPDQILVFADDQSATDVHALAEGLAKAACGRCKAKMIQAPQSVLVIPASNISCVISDLMRHERRFDGMDFAITDFTAAISDAGAEAECCVTLASKGQPQYTIEIRWAPPQGQVRQSDSVHSPDLHIYTVPHLLANAVDGVFSHWGFRSTQRGSDSRSNWIYLELWTTSDNPIRVRAKITWPYGG